MSHHQLSHLHLCLTGVYFYQNRRKPWEAKIRVNGRKTRLGYFGTAEEAAEAYRQAARERDKDKPKMASQYRGEGLG